MKKLLLIPLLLLSIDNVKAYENVNASTIETSSNVKAQVEGYVKGARVIRQYAIGDTYATELELDTRVVFDLYKMRGAL